MMMSHLENHIESCLKGCKGAYAAGNPDHQSVPEFRNSARFAAQKPEYTGVEFNTGSPGM